MSDIEQFQEDSRWSILEQSDKITRNRSDRSSESQNIYPEAAFRDFEHCCQHMQVLVTDDNLWQLMATYGN